MDAFSCGVRNGALETAVVLVEQGRAVFWTQLAHFQTPLDEISASSDRGKALAAEFKVVTLRLHAMLEDSSEDKTSQIGQLTKQQDDVISRIRMLPDFGRFLSPPLFCDLQVAAENGPVIIVNSSQYSCDAMIILTAADPVHVPLHIAQADALELSKKFQSLIEDAGSSGNQLYEIVGVLRTLWDCVVGPIVEALKHSAHLGSRIWWCPTAEFALLPLHAAGPYAKKSHNFSDLYISSYTPTLATLIRARQRIAQDASTSAHFIAIGQGNPDKGKVLRLVAAEVDDVARRVTPILPFTSLMESDATVQRALDALNRHHDLQREVVRDEDNEEDDKHEKDDDEDSWTIVVIAHFISHEKSYGRRRNNNIMDSQHEVVHDEENEQDDEHKKDDDEDEPWSHAKAGGRLERVLLVATLDVLGPAAIMMKCIFVTSWTPG
ncbi:hypothetical protein M405DRAFT_884542 [Rhizopogon salebrosus TDB-379]|nr:hypothetical protein M405DRAFT_884542 [Rhizopogon salebrosus TDB-379]